MAEPDILYETLTPLLADVTPPPPSPPQPPPIPSSPSPESESYVVLRNQTPLTTPQCPLPETTAVDYFSLDLNESEDTFDTPKTPKVWAEDSTPAPEKKLEGAWFSAGSRFRSPMIRLHKEIVDFCDFLSPTPEEQECRNTAIDSVFEVINYIWPNAKAEVFGSFNTGLYLPSSDIDVVIMGSFIQSAKMGLQALSRALSQRGIAKKIQVIAKARVPIIKFVEKKSGFAFDISFDAHNGPKAAEYIKEVVSKWPPLRPLCLILKVFLQQRELNEVYTGGIGSYALLAMIIAMLRTQQENQASPEHNLGILLVKFFDMYGCKLNTTDVGVSCRPGGIFFSKSNKGFTVDGRPSLLAIEDPQDPENDIGKNSFNYYQVKSAFAMAFRTLTNEKAILRLAPNKSILGALVRPDAVLLERKGGTNGKSTLEDLLPGAGGSHPLQQSFEEQQEMYCNWRLSDDGGKEEALPRGNGTTVKKSSGKERKSPKENKSSKKTKLGNGSVEPSTKKKKRKRLHANDGHSNGYSKHGGGSSRFP